jgi:hypothetical protein
LEERLWFRDVNLVVEVIEEVIQALASLLELEPELELNFGHLLHLCAMVMADVMLTIL